MRLKAALWIVGLAVYFVVFGFIVQAEGNNETLGGFTGIAFGIPLAAGIGWYGPRLYERWLP